MNKVTKLDKLYAIMCIICGVVGLATSMPIFTGFACGTSVILGIWILIAR